jgi:hypothetical protein
MPVTRTRLPALTVAASIALTVGNSSACDDFGVLSDDGRYIVLSGDDLSEKDVGSLWWLGIRVIDGIVDGSTFSTAALHVKFANPTTGNLEIPGSRGSVDVLIREFGRSLRTASDLVIAGEDGLRNAWWLASTERKLIVTWQPTDSSARIRILDAKAHSLEQLETNDRSVGGLRVGCQDPGGRIFIAGLRSRLIVDSGISKLAPITGPFEGSDYGIQTGLSANCVAILVRVDEARQDRVEMAKVDMVTGAVSAAFTTSRAANWLLLPDGDRLLAQQTVGERLSDGGDRYLPTRHARILSTDDGAIIAEAELPADGTLSLLSCSANSARVVLAAKDGLYLLDLNNLSVRARAQIPFSSFFVL